MKVKQYQVFVDPIADKKFAAHLEFLARVSENAALRLYDEYEASLLFLRDSPEICPAYLLEKHIDAKLQYHLFGKRYRIVFEILDDQVFVYDIQDCRQNFDKDLI
jgi:mRNA-degrading endonuclease RelE of RelBE toxin-antitoxin system